MYLVYQIDSTVHISLYVSKQIQISTSSVVDNMMESNSILYAKGEKPDHTVSSLAYNIKDVFNIFTCTDCNQIYFIRLGQ